ncbi:MAG: CCA tRNA nucleotidyltransferase [Myxococcaceae bacterium]
MIDLAKVPQAVREVAEQLESAGHQAYLVGGCVRDLLREQTPKDFDLATSATPQQVQAVFKRTIPTGIQHGTVTVVHKGQHVEVTTFRIEGAYVDGRRPTSVEFHTDIEADLSRRDFTINAMAFRPKDANVVDPFGGRADLAAKTIRCVRDAMERFTEDGLRPLRAVRFAAVLAFTIEPLTEAAIGQTLQVFRKVAMERVLQELSKLLAAPGRALGLDLLARTGLLKEILPDANPKRLGAAAAITPELEAQLAVLMADAADPRPNLERLKLPTRAIERACVLVKHQRPPPSSATDKEVRLWVRDSGPEQLDQQLLVSAALGHDVSIAPRARAAAKDPLVPKQLALNGGQIMKALGIGPGPRIGEATRYLMDAVLEDPSRNTPETLTVLLQNFSA